MCNIHDIIIIIMTMMTLNYINRSHASIRCGKFFFWKNITKRPIKIMNLVEWPEQISFFHKYKTGAFKLMMTIFIAEWKKRSEKILLYSFCIFFFWVPHTFLSVFINRLDAVRCVAGGWGMFVQLVFAIIPGIYLLILYV